MRRTLGLVLAAVVLGFPSTTGAQTYNLTELGSFGGPSGAAYAINDLGHVVGFGSFPPNGFIIHAFLWVDGEMTDLGTLGGPDSIAYGINNQGRVVGRSHVGGGVYHAFLWENGWMMDLGTPYNVYSVAEDINDVGQITGQIDDDGFIWEDGVWTELGALPGFTGSHGFGINSAGGVVGSAFSCPFCGAHAFHWADCVMTDLGTLPGYDASVAWKINDVGQIVGYSIPIIPSTPRGTLWDGGEITDLGIGEGTRSMAYSINNSGIIVGYWGFGDHPLARYASKWVDGELIDLNDFIPPDSGWTLHEALDINESGQIVGWGLNPDGLGRAFLLTPCAPADFDCDGTVGAADLAQLLGNWGPCPEPCAPGDAETCPADFNHDCQVTAADLAQLLGNWGP